MCRCFRVVSQDSAAQNSRPWINGFWLSPIRINLSLFLGVHACQSLRQTHLAASFVFVCKEHGASVAADCPESLKLRSRFARPFWSDPPGLENDMTSEPPLACRFLCPILRALSLKVCKELGSRLSTADVEIAFSHEIYGHREERDLW